MKAFNRSLFVYSDSCLYRREAGREVARAGGREVEAGMGAGSGAGSVCRAAVPDTGP